MDGWMDNIRESEWRARCRDTSGLGDSGQKYRKPRQKKNKEYFTVSTNSNSETPMSWADPSTLSWADPSTKGEDLAYNLDDRGWVCDLKFTYMGYEMKSGCVRQIIWLPVSSSEMMAGEDTATENLAFSSQMPHPTPWPSLFEPSSVSFWEKSSLITTSPTQVSPCSLILFYTFVTAFISRVNNAFWHQLLSILALATKPDPWAQGSWLPVLLLHPWCLEQYLQSNRHSAYTVANIWINIHTNHCGLE